MYNTVRADNSLTPAAVTFSPQIGNDRIQLERFIHAVFAEQYAADIRRFMPVLMGLHSQSGSYLAALGLRMASDGPLFLEYYLRQPVEKMLSSAAHYEPDEISRTSIVEVGNLAAHHAGGARWLIIALTAYLQGAGYDWVVFTSVTSLRNSFRKLGLKMYSLGRAELQMLPDAEQSSWGSYYDSHPQVMAVNVHHTYGVLERLLRLENALAALRNIWQQSFTFGHATQVQPVQSQLSKCAS